MCLVVLGNLQGAATCALLVPLPRETERDCQEIVVESEHFSSYRRFLERGDINPSANKNKRNCYKKY